MYTIGVDLGGTNIVAGVVDDTFTILAKTSCKTALPRSAEDLVADMARLCREAVQGAQIAWEDVAYVGIGCPGICNKATGEVEYSCNLPFLHFPLATQMSKATGLPVYIENDANAAALGEAVAGAAKGTHNSICVTLGTGVGGGIIIDDKIYHGFNYAGAELGHTTIMVDGEPCGCGRKGCWEAYASATALIRQTRRAMEANPDSKMWELAGSLDKVNGLTAFDAMRAGDAAGKAVVDTYIGYVACGVTNMINIFQPEVLCIGGGVCKEGDTLLVPLMKYIEQERYSRFSDQQTRITVAQLGNDAGIIGAACLYGR